MMIVKKKKTDLVTKKGKLIAIPELIFTLLTPYDPKNKYKTMESILFFNLK